MTISTLGVTLTVVGVLLSVWSIWFAKKQAMLVADQKSKELISLWAHIDRLRTLIAQSEGLAKDYSILESQDLPGLQKRRLISLYKGLCDEYVRVAELIITKSTNINLDAIESLSRNKVLSTEWQKQRFINLIAERIMTGDYQKLSVWLLLQEKKLQGTIKIIGIWEVDYQ